MWPSGILGPIALRTVRLSGGVLFVSSPLFDPKLESEEFSISLPWWFCNCFLQGH